MSRGRAVVDETDVATKARRVSEDVSESMHGVLSLIQHRQFEQIVAAAFIAGARYAIEIATVRE